MTTLEDSKKRVFEVFVKENQHALDYIKRLIYKHDGFNVTAEKPFVVEDYNDLLVRSFKLSKCSYNDMFTLIEGVAWYGDTCRRLQFSYCYMFLKELDQQATAFTDMTRRTLNKAFGDLEKLLDRKPTETEVVEMSKDHSPDGRIF